MPTPPPEEEAGGEGWIVSFADLMTLLFAAFVVLYGLKPEGESDRVLGVTSSIREAFIEIPDDIPFDERQGPVKRGVRALQHFKGDTAIQPVIKKYNRSDSLVAAIKFDKAKMQKLINNLAKTSQGVNESLRKAMTVDDDEYGFTIRMLASHFYRPGQWRMQKQGREHFAEIGKMLKEMNRPLVIEGHTDSIVPKGTFSNYEIGALRAGYAARMLIKDWKIPAKTIQTASYAATRPIGSNATKEGRTQNRRIEIKVRYHEL